MSGKIYLDTLQIKQMQESYASLAEAMASYKNMSKTMPTTLKSIADNYSSFSQASMKNVVASMNLFVSTYNKLTLPAFRSETFTKSVSSALQEYARAYTQYDKVQMSEMLKQMSETLRFVSSSMVSEQMKELSKVDYTDFFSKAFQDTSSWNNIVRDAYSMVQEELAEDGVDDEIFTEEEIQEAIQEQTTQPERFQERVAKWTNEKMIRYFIVWHLICFVYSNFFQPYFQENVGVPVTAYVVSNIKELPKKGAKVVGQLKEEVEAIIMENTRYYYKVHFVEENGEEKEGYVAKRNIKICEDEVGTECKKNDDKETIRKDRNRD